MPVGKKEATAPAASALTQRLESVLFVASKPLTTKTLAKLLEEKPQEVEAALNQLRKTYKERKSGLQLTGNGAEAQLTTASETSGVVQNFLRDEMTGELTTPSLETLTIIAYRGPVAKAEIEQIRGVNCSLILRNLMIRGLVEAEEEPRQVIKYRVSLDFLRYLGIEEAAELPDYERLSNADVLTRLLEGKAAPTKPPSP